MADSEIPVLPLLAWADIVTTDWIVVEDVSGVTTSKVAVPIAILLVGSLSPSSYAVPYFTGVDTISTLQFEDDTALTNDSSVTIPSQHAVKTYVDAAIAGVGGGAQTPWAQDIDGGGFNLSNIGLVTFPDNIRQVFNPGTDAAGINVGEVFSDPTTLLNGDMWYDGMVNVLKLRINGVSISFGYDGMTSSVILDQGIIVQALVCNSIASSGDLGLRGNSPIQGSAIPDSAGDVTGGAIQDAEARTAINTLQDNFDALLAFLRTRADIAT